MSSEAVDCHSAWVSVNHAGRAPNSLQLMHQGIIHGRTHKSTRTTHQAQNNIYLSLNTIGDKSAAVRGNAVGDRASRSNPTVKTQAFDNHSISNRGQCCPARSEMSRVKSVDTASSLCISGLYIIHCIPVYMPAIVISAAPQDIAATEMKKKKKFKIQVTENRNLLLLEVFSQSRRFCIISYKSPIQTELMEYTLKQTPPSCHL